MANVGIMGAGSWGTALALLLHKNDHKVTVWSISEEEVEMLSTRREHVSKLPGVPIPEDMVFTSDLEGAVKDRGFSCDGGSVAIYQEYGQINEPVYSHRPDYRRCGQRD